MELLDDGAKTIQTRGREPVGEDENVVAHGVAEGKQHDGGVGEDLTRCDGLSDSHDRRSVLKKIAPAQSILTEIS